jgi:hypothetical protein
MARVTYFKKVRGEWKPMRGNPLKKNVAAGHFDKHGKFHKHKGHATHTRRRKAHHRRKKR